MKICNLLCCACFASISFAVLANNPVIAQASGRNHAPPVKALHQKPPVYEMVRRSVIGNDTFLDEQVWDVQLATMIPPQVNVNPHPPDYLFKSLDSPPLLTWVSSLPPKSAIDFDIFTGPREEFGGPSRSGKVPAKLQQEIDAFSQFCAKHNVYVVEMISSG